MANETYNAVTVDEMRCHLFSSALKPLLAGRPSHATPFSLSRLDRTSQIVALTHLIAICDRLNWDLLLGPIASSLWELTDGFKTRRLVAVEQAAFRNVFGTYRRNDGRVGYRRRLQDLTEVSAYLAECQGVDRLSSASRVEGREGLVELLRHAPVYSKDPLMKKANVLLAELHARSLVEVEDPENIGPAIDYHLIRLYLRTGRVQAKSKELEARLIQGSSVRIEVITEIRRAVADAMRYTASVLGISTMTLGDVEWRFARKSCTREHAACLDASCSFAEVCPSAFVGLERLLNEPRSKHGFY